MRQTFVSFFSNKFSLILGDSNYTATKFRTGVFSTLPSVQYSLAVGTDNFSLFGNLSIMKHNFYLVKNNLSFSSRIFRVFSPVHDEFFSKIKYDLMCFRSYAHSILTNKKTLFRTSVSLLPVR